MHKKIVIISSGQPSANPRAVKEAILLSEKNFNVTFIYCPLSLWADAFDKKLFEKHSTIKWIQAGYHSQANKAGYLYARLRNKTWGYIARFVHDNANINIKAFVLFSQELLKEALKHRADLYIGHNLGSIAAVSKASKKYNAKAGFDAEDFHRGEVIVSDKKSFQIAAIENKYFPLMDYCTVASPMIGEEYKEFFPGQTFLVINNVFAKSNLKKEIVFKPKKTLDLFWFSQFIGEKRGIENIIDALNHCKNLDINLHLLGNINERYKAKLLERIHERETLFFLPPSELDKIFIIASEFDIGLASETAFSDNNNYALSNKIFTYLIAGNCILFSSTDAQKNFLKQYPNIGILYEIGNSKQLSNIIRELYSDRTLLNKMKKNALKVAKEKLNWEFESEIFLNQVNKFINKD